MIPEVQPTMPNWLISIAKTAFSPTWKVVQRYRSRHRVKERLESPSREEVLALNGSYLGAKESQDRIFSWHQTGGGLDPLEAHLHFLLIEGAAIQMRREEKEGRAFCQWYRLKPWFYEYLEAHPELRTPPGEEAV